MNPAEKFKDHHQRLIDSFQEHKRKVNHDPENHLADLIQFIQHELLPHAEAEEEVLYKKVDEVAGTTLGTATMRRDHEEISARAQELENFESKRDSSGEQIRGAVNEFAAILFLHFDKEEEVLLPVLSSELSEQEFESILSRVHEKEHSHH